MRDCLQRATRGGSPFRLMELVYSAGRPSLRPNRQPGALNAAGDTHAKRRGSRLGQPDTAHARHAQVRQKLGVRQRPRKRLTSFINLRDQRHSDHRCRPRYTLSVGQRRRSVGAQFPRGGSSFPRSSVTLGATCQRGHRRMADADKQQEARHKWNIPSIENCR
jgi:hypothetical protein